VIGSTIGNLVAGGIAGKGNPFQTKAARTAASNNIFESITGRKPMTAQEIAATAALTVAQKSGKPGDVNAALSDVFDAAGATSREAQALVDSFRSKMTVAPQTGDIVVNGSDRNLNWNTLPLVDRAGVWTGRKATEIEQYGQAYLDKNPLIKVGLNVASLTLTVAGGPTKYVAGTVFDKFKGQIESAVTRGYSSAGWDGEPSALGGKGAVLAGGVLLSGLGSLKTVGGWKGRVRQGREFDTSRQGIYDYDQIDIRNPNGSGNRRVDSINLTPGTEQIISRKFTQFSGIKEKTAFGYIDEIDRKYAPLSVIADTPRNRQLGISGQTISGAKILEVPVQRRPIPQSVLDYVTKNKVIIRDVNGKVY
jgi:hypothetical protein